MRTTRPGPKRSRTPTPTGWSALLGAAILLSASSVAADARATGPATAGGAPAYRSLRFEEDWSSYRGDDADAFAPLKHVELSRDGRLWASFGGQLRERVELWRDFRFGDTPADGENDVFLLHRLRAHGDFHYGETFRVFLELKSALSTDRELPLGTRSLDVDNLDLQNGFADFRVPLADGGSVVLRAGRQELLFGAERLVSPLDWTNTRRTFDGSSLILDAANWRVHGFFTSPVELQKHNLNHADEDQQFYGVYASGSQPFAGDGPAGLDVYWLGLERENTGFNATTGEEDRHTLGARLFGPIAGETLDYEMEAAYQFGDVGGAEIDAVMLVAELGLDTATDPRALRLVAGVDYASGDDDPADGDVQTFNQLFPLGHAFLGYIDVVGRQNVVDARLRATAVPVGSLRVTLDAHHFRRASDDDALYDVTGAVVRADGGTDEREIGTELDLTLRQPIGRHFDVLAGYSHFFAGDFLDETGAAADIDFAYLQGQLTF